VRNGNYTWHDKGEGVTLAKFSGRWVLRLYWDWWKLNS